VAIIQTFRKQGRATADAKGSATVEIVWGGAVDAVVTNANIKVDPVPPATTPFLIPTGVAFVLGGQVDTSDMATNATSDSRIVVPAAASYKFVWTGADVGAVCTLFLTGVLYTAGTAPLE